MTSRPASNWSAQARQMLLAMASLLALVLVFSLLKPEAFMTTDNLIGVLQSTTVIGVLAIASTFVIVTGGIDLSVGVLMTFCAVTGGVVMAEWRAPCGWACRRPSARARCAGPSRAWPSPGCACRPLSPPWA